MQQQRDVWVYMQRHDNGVAEASLEVLGKARELADVLGSRTVGILAGSGLRQEPETVQAYGADTVYVLESPHLDAYTSCAAASALCRFIRRHQPEILLLAATPQGRDLAPRLASALGAGLTADCTDLRIGDYTDSKTGKSHRNILLQIRPAWGGNIIATIVNPATRPQMATIREGIMKLPRPEPSARGDIQRIPADITAADVKSSVLQLEAVEHTLNLKRAGIIVAGGAGMGSAGGFALVRQLAHLLGAEVGATRAAVDAGFIGHEHQVGQTGSSVRPKLYIACGISGAVQHLAGMEESGKIIAVNSDPEAPIFKVAHYGIVGDACEVLPRMMGIYKTLSH
jgi:electron transfer flavoprotein alpha subunit